MNEVKSYIIKNLNCSLRGKKMDIPLNTEINWNEVIEECREHQISSLVYSGISKESLKNIDNNILDKWKKETFMSGVYQINHIKQISRVLSIFNDNNISVIALKGLVVRDLYPKSELRTMGDADILVHENDLENVINILEKEGYIEQGRNEYHIAFIRGNSHIEVHWTLDSEERFDAIDELKDETWSRAIDVKVGDSKSLSMCDEDLLLYSCMHMAKHFINSGFGIRQVCDVFLLVEKRGQYIDWDSFINRTKRSGIYKFTMSIFAICNRLFRMSIPDELKGFVEFDNVYLDELIDTIWANGVHGKKNIAGIVARQFTEEGNGIKNNWIDRIKKIYFPTGNNLSERYGYAKRNKILLPIAWIHRLINAIFIKDYSLSDKVKLSMQGANMSKKYSELLSWLEL